MASKLIFTISAIQLLTFAGIASAEEFEAAIDESCRRAMKDKPSETLRFHLVLDSKGKVVHKFPKEGNVTKQTKVVMGTFNEKTKRWVPGKAIEGGIKADLFDVKDSTVRALITIGADKKTITQVLVTKENEPLEMADREFDAILKGHGAFTNGRGSVSFVRLERDENGTIIKTFALSFTGVTKETVIAMAKYNEKEKKWEAGEPIPNGVYGDVFKDFKQPVYVRIIPREDNRGIGQILLIQVGADPKK